MPSGVTRRTADGAASAVRSAPGHRTVHNSSLRPHDAPVQSTVELGRGGRKRPAPDLGCPPKRIKPTDLLRRPAVVAEAAPADKVKVVEELTRP
ncbi:hypothetical protein [Streptomyces adelaidensis]|jgi:hypothetical protein|uniref:hypothetical protein n=1 Tax=Streptomyces adelaidensis TaxID=2796465 RepID=UPI00190360A7|nr:hypothetical protein [Streptomyces adelaidensis]